MPLLSLSKNTQLFNVNLAVTGLLGGYILIGILLALLVIIWLLIRHIRKSTDVFVDNWKNEQRKNSGSKVTGLILLLAMSLSGNTVFAQTDSLQTASDSGNIAGLPNFLFYLILSLIILEVVIILFLTSQTRLLLKKKKDLESGN